MAQFSIDEYNEPTNSNENRPTFFSLADGEEKIVRFMHDSRADFRVLTMHEIMMNGNTRRVACLNEAAGQHNCPFCESNVPFSDRWGNEHKISNLVARCYIRMIEYSQDEQGNVVTAAKVWDRPVSFARTLVGYLDNYGPLSDVICKITRHGSGLNTKYEVIPNLNKNIYRDDIYVKDASLFEGYNEVGTIVLNKDAEEMNYYLSNGEFPDTTKKDEPVKAPVFNPGNAQPRKQQMPWEQPGSVSRPIRTY